MLHNIAQIGEVLTGLHPHVAELSSGELAGNALAEKIGPVSARLMSVRATIGLVTAATVETLKAILGEFEQLSREAAPDNTARPNALYFCGAAAEALGDASANLGDSAAAQAWYAKSAAFLDEAGDGENAGKPRQKAAALPDVESASAQAMVMRSLGPQQIMMGIQLATGVMTSVTGAGVGLTALIQALEKLAGERPALSKVLVQVGLKKVPVDKLTEHDKQVLVASLEMA